MLPSAVSLFAISAPRSAAVSAGAGGWASLHPVSALPPPDTALAPLGYARQTSLSRDFLPRVANLPPGDATKTRADSGRRMRRMDQRSCPDRRRADLFDRGNQAQASPQRGHASTSTSNARRIRSAHAQSRAPGAVVDSSFASGVALATTGASAGGASMTTTQRLGRGHPGRRSDRYGKAVTPCARTAREGYGQFTNGYGGSGVAPPDP